MTGCSPSLISRRTRQLPKPGAAEETGAAPAAEPAANATPARAARAELSIDSVTITDARRELNLIRAGHVVAAAPEDLTPPGAAEPHRERGTIRPAIGGAVWFRRQAAPGWSPQDPVSLSPSGQGEFDLSSVPAGAHDVRLLAWATDPGATLAAVTLPRLAFGH